MRKQADIKDWDVAAPVKAFQGVTGSPLGAAAATYGLGALGLWLSGPTGVRFLANQGGRFMDPEAKDEMMRHVEENMPSMRKRMAFGLPAIPALAILAGSYKSGFPGMGLTSWNKTRQPWMDELDAKNKAADQAEARATDNYNKANAHAWTPEAEAERARKKDWQEKATIWEKMRMEKGASQIMPLWVTNTRPLTGDGYQDIMNQPTIPLAHSRDLVYNDPVMNAEQKGRLINVFDSAPADNAPWLTPRDVAVGAIRLGVGALAGSMTGRVVGSLFGVPKEVSTAMSRVGGIGGALINLGIV